MLHGNANVYMKYDLLDNNLHWELLLKIVSWASQNCFGAFDVIMKSTIDHVQYWISN